MSVLQDTDMNRDIILYDHDRKKLRLPVEIVSLIDANCSSPVSINHHVTTTHAISVDSDVNLDDLINELFPDEMTIRYVSADESVKEARKAIQDCDEAYATMIDKIKNVRKTIETKIANHIP